MVFTKSGTSAPSLISSMMIVIQRTIQSVAGFISFTLPFHFEFKILKILFIRYKALIQHNIYICMYIFNVLYVCVCVCRTHIVTVQHSEEFRVCDEFDSR